MVYQVLVLIDNIMGHCMMMKDAGMVCKEAINSQVSKWVSNEDGRVLT